MLNIEDFTARLQMLLDYYHLTASAFADSIDVQRSGISHILSGRNKPSLDFILKITSVYKDVPLEWLIHGKGSFPKNSTDKSFSAETNDVKPTQATPPPSVEKSTQNLFDSNEVEYSSKKETLKPILENNEEHLATNKNKTIDRILIFYSDKTFESYTPSS
ncbi:helix-turn-helix transcriptional regulator [Neptunitalea lumnitzerae]|uniref:Transcriptional regulator n=1 Tax=Neptunitalea lumnitzerae TaxID=2965509 RepID=A0ABQ5MJD3_9FLAO|nr:helix-turn-helix transcriptional regulator [Neptunitalea sp. Y10]GLB49530.1 transcriptional regulator [Neptunitalea sp. Y10]